MSERADAQIRVASYNIRKCVGLDRRRDPDRILRVIGEIGADVIALQEADRRIGPRSATLAPDHILNRTGLRPLALPGREESMGWHGNAILVREGLEVRRTAAIALPSLEPRGAVLAEISHGGRDLRVLGVHLALIAGYRRRQIAAIRDWLDSHEPLPTVILGDFNEWAPEGAIRGLSHDGGFHVFSPGRSYHSAYPLGPLDRIALGPGVQLDAAGVHAEGAARRASDHLPIWADLRLDPAYHV